MSTPTTDDLNESVKSLKEHVQIQDELVASRLKIWILGAIVVQVVPMLTIAFFMGGIYTNLNMTTNSMKRGLEQLQRRELERVRWEYAIEAWGREQRPPLILPPRSVPSEHNQNQ